MSIEAVFYLYISMQGVPSAVPFEAGEYQTRESCDATGIMITRNINTRDEIVERNDELRGSSKIVANHECTTTRVTTTKA